MLLLKILISLLNIIIICSSNYLKMKMSPEKNVFSILYNLNQFYMF